ncbi:hypothetical protein B0H14DRAFT_3862548 [Mycena olivaceomarginata]|nr:hypothetical protein B0H14DRAFT_3862548 [Mycena olivaceomarginata]
MKLNTQKSRLAACDRAPIRGFPLPPPTGTLHPHLFLRRSPYIGTQGSCYTVVARILLVHRKGWDRSERRFRGINVGHSRAGAGTRAALLYSLAPSEAVACTFPSHFSLSERILVACGTRRAANVKRAHRPNNRSARVPASCISPSTPQSTYRTMDAPARTYPLDEDLKSIAIVRACASSIRDAPRQRESGYGDDAFPILPHLVIRVFPSSRNLWPHHSIAAIVRIDLAPPSTLPYPQG